MDLYWDSVKNGRNAENAKEKVMSKTFFRNFDGMTWPAPCEKMSNLEWSLRHGEFVSRKDALLAAAIIAAYRQLVSDPLIKRQRVVSQVRQGPNI